MIGKVWKVSMNNLNSLFAHKIIVVKFVTEEDREQRA
jgi:hypothetical protein